MPTRVAMSESEYLETPFPGPEPDFVDGEVIERGMPTNHHSAIQCFFSGRLWPMREQGLFTRPELRLRVASGRYRVADLAIFTQRPTGRMPSEAPLVIVEILSPDDRWRDLLARFADYNELGVAHIWVVDPELRRLYVYENEGLARVDHFELPDYRVSFTREEIMADVID
jgi:Uma2 family endonuclease